MGANLGVKRGIRGVSGEVLGKGLGKGSIGSILGIFWHCLFDGWGGDMWGCIYV